jgi:fucose permease
MRTLAGIVALMAVFTLAICFILIGSISEEIKARLGIDNSEVGSLASALFLTSLAVQLFVGILVDKLGHKTMALVGFLATSAAIFLLAAATSLSAALPACCLLGAGAMCVNTVGNTLIPIVLFDGKDPARASNFGNGFVGLAFVLTPVALNSLIRDLGLSYAIALSTVASLVLCFAVVALFATYPTVSTGYRFSEAVRLLRDPPVLAAGLALLFYIALEISMNTWIKPFMIEIHGGGRSPGDARFASWVLSFFGLALAMGRFLSSSIKNLSAVGTRLIAILSLVTTAAIVVMAFTRSPWLAVLAVLVTGFALAPMFPTIVGVTFAQYEPGKYGSIFGIIFAIGLLGPTMVPKLIGALSLSFSVQKSLLIAAAIAALLCAASILMGRAGRAESGSGSLPKREQATVVR